MQTMGHFLADNNRQIYSVRPDATVREALELMAHQKTTIEQLHSCIAG